MANYVLTENGNIKVKDGHPLVKDDSGEYTVDALGARDKIAALNSEAATYRTKMSEYKDSLKKFSGIEDPKAALDALQTVKSLTSEHTLEIDKLKQSMTDVYETKLETLGSELVAKDKQLFNATVITKFATSPIVKGLVLTPDIAASFFGKNFKSDGTAVDNAGNIIYSKQKPGEPADFDEALSSIIDQYPNKEDIIKPTGGSGTGSTGNTTHQGTQDTQMSSVDLIRAGLESR